jgi:hypothetical protein
MQTPPGQTLQSLDFKDYVNLIVVFGSRGYNDRRQFHNFMVEYIKRFDKPILFISGAASTGADALIIQWCKKFNYPCKEMPADWDGLGKRAGFVRNSEMAKLATHAVSFYDGVSPGTAHMLDECIAKQISVKVVKIK